MPVLTLSNGLHSNAKKIVAQLEVNSGYAIITDKMIIEKTASRHHLKLSTIRKVILTKQIAFNDFTHEKEKCMACLKQVVAQYSQTDNCLFHGILGHLIPRQITHVIRILVITDKETRVKNCMALNNSSRKEALKEINRFDKLAILWTRQTIGKKAFDESIYDIVIPTDKLNTRESVALIEEHAKNLNSIPDTLVQKENTDFELAARVEVALAEVGNKLYIRSDSGNITVTIDKSVMMLAKFQQKITAIARKINGVKSVETNLGKNYYSNTIVRQLDVDTPARLLLVDDEKEFVQTLSERLKLRQFPSKIAYDGKQALDLTNKEDLDVMILDLKMPGIDGFEVLKKIKETKPHIEVIILTGHGSAQDKEKCMELGAFAYLQKPADIDLLTSTMKQAYEKINTEKE
ncbi:MAG: response regulator [Deltaproteobacteria bacterium]|nr:response regulator [Deltaproteobacteria bacterium]